MDILASFLPKLLLIIFYTTSLQRWRLCEFRTAALQTTSWRRYQHNIVCPVSVLSAHLQLYQVCLHLELQLLQPIQLRAAQTRMGEPKMAVEAAVKAFGMVCSSWPYMIVMRPQTRGKFARDPGTAEVGC